MFRGHYLDSARDAPSPNRSGTILPRFIVMHYTGTWEVGSVLRTFASPASRVSAHITVDTDSTVYQHVPFNVKAWHAGPSAFGGYQGLNAHSIGIEIVNPGFCRKRGSDYFDANGQKAPDHFTGDYVAKRKPRAGSGTFYWPEYPTAQLDAVEKVTRALVSKYPIIDIVTHEEIDLRGWKTDPGPAFPISRFKKLLPQRDADFRPYEVTASKLNVRAGPGTEFAVVSSLSKDAKVSEKGRRGDWVRVSDDGWVHGAYLRQI